MQKILKSLDAICLVGAAVAAFSVTALAAMLIFEVITTSFFAYSQPWAIEYSAYLLAAALFAGSGWTLGQGGHIRVNLLLQTLGARGLRIADLAMTLCALGLSIYICIAVTENALRSLDRGSVSYYPTRTPVWIPQSVLAFSWIVLSLGLLARALRLVTGRQPGPTDSGASA